MKNSPKNQSWKINKIIKTHRIKLIPIFKLMQSEDQVRRKTRSQLVDDDK